MKKCSLYEYITLMVIFSLSFFAGCSSDKIAGTSEETNEFAYRVSSSSEEESSSSSAKSSSSSRVVSSSSHTISSSSAKSSSSYAESSNSSLPGATSSSTGVDVNNNSSSSEKPNEGTAKPDISLDYYLKLLNQESDSFDSGVMATSIDLNTDGDPQNPNPPMTTEFDTPWPHKIVKQNVDALQEYFPMAFAMYPQIISAIKNETLDENCGLYTFNVYSDGLTAAYIVAEITENTIKVIDLPAGECKALSLTQMSRFLFYYCGELNSHAEAEHIKVDVDLSDNCPNLKTGNEWVKL
ncbi:hypothetical protein [Fibrobacter succinogenes]|uniref:Lipoprotein n=1 Tax=Fibrobacter succinogenes TaxID=833 RepID=A0A380S8Z9_FIBSU|nr:hypothetical protein [Fibrobacter succinogenes]PWJ33633.1 hypothetical protein IE02_2808 [Fibrobacter succinogenes subsp. elongatus]SUQ26004.1 hypothetical protein SAMN05661053_2808 [Fibrobacter succinogenes]